MRAIIVMPSWAGLVALLLLAACSDSSAPATAPVRGETRLCSHPTLGCEGVQTYGENGSWEECDCSVLPREIAEPQPPSGELTPLVGRGCEEESDCGAGLRCVTAASNDFFGTGGVAGGYCTQSCSADADCTAVDPDSECLRRGTAGLCMRRCFSKAPAPGEGKCAGRPELVCESVAARGEEAPLPIRQPGRCLPRCRSDADCPGRVCRIGDGLCADSQDPGGAVGEACTTDEQPSSCASGVCLGLGLAPDSTRGACSASCRITIPQPTHNCGSPPTGPVEAACLIPQVQSFLGNESIGDLGLCLELCDDLSDCNQTEDLTCLPDENVFEAFGRAGLCLPPPPPIDAGVDAGVDAGSSLRDAGPSLRDAGIATSVTDAGPPDASITPGVPARDASAP